MIPWVTVKPALRSLFSDLGGNIQTVWNDKQRPYIDSKGQEILLLRVRSVASKGVDDRRYTDLGLSIPLHTLEETANGHRLTSLDVRVESFRQDDDRFAFNAVEAIRTKLRFGSSRVLLKAQNIAIVRMGQTLDLSGIVKDSRATSVAVLELMFNIGITTADSDEAHHVSNIEEVDNPVDHASTVIS